MNYLDYKILIFSLISMGFFGGFTHCVGMCSPFVFSQINNRLSNIKIEQYNLLNKIRNFALISYHLGRITTYGLIGLLISIIGSGFSHNIFFKIIASTFLFIASISFLKGCFAGSKKLINFKFSAFCKIKFLINKFLFIEFLKSFFRKQINIFSFKIIAKIIGKLIVNPTGFKGYFLGLLLGFIPCGLLYSAFIMVAVIDKPIIAMTGMLLFGISTIPALLISGIGGYFILENLKFIWLFRIISITNFLLLNFMALKIIKS